MKQRISLSQEQQDRLYEEVLPDTLANAYALADGFMTEPQMEIIADDMAKVRRNRLLTAFRAIQTGESYRPSEHPVFATTFSEIVGNGDNLDAALKLIQGTPKFRTPALVQLGRQVEEVVQRFGEAEGSRLLQAWKLGTVTVLDYLGRDGELKSLPTHKDSGRTPSGVRFAIGHGEGLTTIEDEMFYTKTGDLTAFLGADLSRRSGIPQKNHSIEALGPKKSVLIDSQIIATSDH